jgi:hypothetical protein
MGEEGKSRDQPVQKTQARMKSGLASCFLIASADTGNHSYRHRPPDTCSKIWSIPGARDAEYHGIGRGSHMMLYAARRNSVARSARTFPVHSPRLSAASMTPSAKTSPRTEVPVTSGCLWPRLASAMPDYCTHSYHTHWVWLTTPPAIIASLPP